jgi:hypothetical protein
MPLIEFHTEPALFGKIPEPFPASRAVPDWLKQLPVDLEGGPTIKRCAPFLQAITAGYIIPVPFDVQFWYLPEGELVFNSVGDLPRRHLPSQQVGTPFSASKIIKLSNPWLIKTPPGYSTLFIRPFNRFDCPIIPLTGLVETDTYYDAVQLPSVCQMPPGSSYTLARGAPLVQVVPILRESWTSTANLVDAARRQKSIEVIRANPHFYKEVHWRKIEYG